MKKIFALLIIAACIENKSFCQNENMIKKNEANISNDKIAIDGYDPVSYFTSKKAIKGKKDFKIISDGIVYQFSSAQNAEAFKANPAKYQPQYGGWCAYAMGTTGSKVEVDPETFKILDGKLYLFYNKFFNNTLKSWNKDETGLKNNADANWKKIINEK